MQTLQTSSYHYNNKEIFLLIVYARRKRLGFHDIPLIIDFMILTTFTMFKYAFINHTFISK